MPARASELATYTPVQKFTATLDFLVFYTLLVALLSDFAEILPGDVAFSVLLSDALWANYPKKTG